MKTGIYMIACTLNKKVYVGSSKNISNRKENHKWSLKKNKHHCDLLQEDYNIYGEEYFIFSILEECSEDLLFKKESEWAHRYNAFHRDFGYCVMDPLTDKPVPGEFMNVVKKQTVHINEDFTINVNHSIITIDVETKELDFYLSVREFFNKKEGNRKLIYRCINYWEELKKGIHKRTTGSHQGLVFIYAQQYDTNFDYTKYMEKSTEKRITKVHIHMKDRKLCRKETIAKNISTEEERIFVSTSEMIREMGFMRSKVGDVLAGKRKSHRGYTFYFTGKTDRDKQL